MNTDIIDGKLSISNISKLDAEIIIDALCLYYNCKGDDNQDIDKHIRLMKSSIEHSVNLITNNNDQSEHDRQSRKRNRY